MELGKAKCTVHFLPALAGDCFVLEFDNKNCILIDCGYPLTYKEKLKPLLQKLAKKGCKISLMVITHMDADHISGAISFLEDNGDANAPRVIQVDEIWHNGIYNTIMDSEIISRHESDQITESILKKCKEISGSLKMQLQGESGSISAMQSKTFESICAKYNYVINKQFNDHLIIKGRMYCFDNCEINVLSPGATEINKLRKWLNKEMILNFGKDYIWNRTEAFAELFNLIAFYHGQDEIGPPISEQISSGIPDAAEWLNTSLLPEMNVVNTASIVLDIRYKGLKLLFMGDSESDLWKDQLEAQYDLIKVSHHGTTKPNLAWLNKKIKARKLLVSTNGGKHGHPENDFLARAIMGDFEQLFFNYSIARKADILLMQKKYNFTAEFEKIDIELC